MTEMCANMIQLNTGQMFVCRLRRGHEGYHADGEAKWNTSSMFTPGEMREAEEDGKMGKP